MTDDTTSSGCDADWFKVTRSVFQHPVLAGEFDRRSAWLWLVANAAWKQHRVRTRGGAIELRRGQVVIGSEHLAKVFGWSRKRVRNFLAELRREGMLEPGQRNGQYATVATISNYGRYQGENDDAGPAKRPIKGQRGANEGPYRRRGRKERREEPCEDALRADQKNLLAAEHSILAAALTDYNRAAELIGFTRCTTLTEARGKFLAKRLRDLGRGDLEAGARRLQEALSAIPHWSFLAGRERGRDGRVPFRLDLERLLSTGSGLGDVLAKLCDLHDERGPARMAVPATEARSRLSAWDDAQADELAAQRARLQFDPSAEGGGPDALH